MDITKCLEGLLTEHEEFTRDRTDGRYTVQRGLEGFHLGREPLSPTPTWQLLRMSYPDTEYVIEDGYQSLDRLFILESTFSEQGDLTMARLLCGTLEGGFTPTFSLERENEKYLLRADTTRSPDYRKFVFVPEKLSLQVFYRDTPQHTFLIPTKGKTYAEMMDFFVKGLTQE